MENKKIIRYFACCFLICLSVCFSCNISKQIEETANKVLTSAILTVVTINQTLVESTIFIYEKDSIQSGAPFYIHQFNISFISKTDSFNLQIDSIEVIWIKDSAMQFRKISLIEDHIFYDELTIPQHNFPYLKDRVRINIKCEYLPNTGIKGYTEDFNCFTANYIMKNQMILHLNSNFEKCRR